MLGSRLQQQPTNLAHCVTYLSQVICRMFVCFMRQTNLAHCVTYLSQVICRMFVCFMRQTNLAHCVTYLSQVICSMFVCFMRQTNLAHCVTYLSRASKSNESYAALCNARKAIRQHRGPQPGVPLHLRNATTQLAHRMGLLIICPVNMFSTDGVVRPQLHLVKFLTKSQSFNAHRQTDSF